MADNLNTVEEVEAKADAEGHGTLIKAIDVESGETFAAAHMTDGDDFVIFTGPQFKQSVHKEGNETVIRIKKRQPFEKTRPIKDDPGA